MRKIVFSIIVVFLTCFGLADLCPAKTGYVSDMLILTLREGPSRTFPVIKKLQSDTPLTIMEEKDLFLKVGLASGETGWVDKRFVVYTLPKSTVIEQLKAENKALEEQIAQLKTAQENMAPSPDSPLPQISEEKLQALELELNNANEKINALETASAQATEKYQTLLNDSDNIKEIVSSNKRLKRENVTLAKEIQGLEDQTSYLFRTGMIKWFLAGVGVLLLGWILGHSVSLGKKRRNSLLD